MRSHPYIHLMGQGFVAQWFCPHDAPRIVPWDGDLYKGAPSPCPHGVPQLTPWDGHLWHEGGSHPAGLSSFQQSVAMDRIQRIIGVLQKPEMG